MDSPSGLDIFGTLPPEPITCDTIETVSADFVNYATLPMLLLTILMSFATKRKSWRLDLCGGRPGILIPINLVAGSKARAANVAAFIILTSRLLDLINGTRYWDIDAFDDPDFDRKFGFLKVFIKMVNSVQLSICFYPLFACIEYRRYILMNILGLLNLVPWILYTVLRFEQCDFTRATWEISAYMSVVGNIPEFLSYLVLTVCFVVYFIKNVKQARLRRKTYLTCLMPEDLNNVQSREPSYMRYVRSLFTRPPIKKPYGFLEELTETLTYRKIPGLKTSPRVMVAIAVSGVIMYRICFDITGEVFSVQSDILDILAQLKEQFSHGNDTDAKIMYDYVHSGYVGFYICNSITLATQCINLWRVYINYRTDYRLVLRGEKDLLAYVDMEPADLVVYSSRYIGYQIVFSLYSYFVEFVVLFLVLVVVFIFLIVLPLKWGFSTFVLDLLDTHWKTLLISLMIYYGQVIMAKYVFFVGTEEQMTFSNRRLYHVSDYFLLFFNALLSFFTSIKRMLISAIVGIVYLSRLDQPGIIRGFERFDSGHKAYLGMLYMETRQNNPIVNAFIDILRRDQITGTDERVRHKRVRMRWFKTITLANNPSLVIEQLSKTILSRSTDEGDAGVEKELYPTKNDGAEQQSSNSDFIEAL